MNRQAKNKNYRNQFDFKLLSKLIPQNKIFVGLSS